MIGATVLQKGTNNGIVTGLDGKFTLTLSNEAEQTLLISMIGFIEQSIAIKKNHPFINVTLEEDIAQLDEVVVVGYGTQKKVSLTGSISNVGAEDLKSMPAEQNRVVGLDALLFVLGQNRTIAQITLGTQVEVLVLEVSYAFSGLFQSLLSPRSDFLANTVAGNNGDFICLCHSSRSLLALSPAGPNPLS